ncbi:MAG: hypothetical protein ACFFD4_04395 [Candidatus Odinarchaeota archaeon]
MASRVNRNHEQVNEKPAAKIEDKCKKRKELLKTLESGAAGIPFPHRVTIQDGTISS